MRQILSMAVFMLLCCNTFSQIEITGNVTDEGSNQPLPGVNVTLKGESLGTTTDFEGNFSLKIEQNLPLTIQVSLVGYGTQVIAISENNQHLSIVLKEEATILGEVVVSASRTPERIMESPVTVELMGIKDIEYTSSPTFYDGLENLKGVDINANSLTFKSINTRGFATFSNERFVQLVDGMDNAAPALNFPIGNLLGMNELDVYSVEILPGAASALYGPNAFNGALFMRSKNPFDYTGVDVYGKSGMTSSSNAGDNVFYDVGFRAAWKTSEKFAFKISGSYLKGTEWYATDYRDYNNDLTVPGEPTPINPETGQPAFDRMNIYGDEVTLGSAGTNLNEVAQVLEANGQLPPGSSALVPAVDVSRTGYREQDLTDYNAESLKYDVAFHFRPNADDLEIILNTKGGRGNTIYQGTNRYNIKNFLMFQHKIEVRNDNFFVRAYMSHDDAGDSYDMRFTGINMNKVNSQEWFGTYAGAYAQAVAGGASDTQAHTIARQTSDAAYTPQPGTPEFNQLFDQITQDPDIATGSKFQDESKLYHGEGNYNFAHLIDWAEFQVGGSYRLYDLNSGGTIFTDYDGSITYGEYGGYAQMQKKMVDDRLKFTGSLRFDKSQNFDGNFSPRVSLGYTMGENRNHNFRASFQTGFRNPTTQDQYIGLDAGRALLVGSAPDNIDRYVSSPITLSAAGAAIVGSPTAVVTGRNGYHNSWTVSSVQEFIATGGTDISILQSGEAEYVKPEKVTAFELGYRGNINNKFTIDLSGYYNVYEDFIGNTFALAPIYGQIDFSDGGLAGAALQNGDYKVFQLYTNSKADITSFGGAVEVTAKVGKGYLLMANYTLARFDFDQASDPDYQAGFNTPEHKVKLGVGNPNVYKNLGFNVNLRWSDEYLWESTIANAIIEERTVIDAQVSYAIPKWKSLIKVGAANLGGEEYLVAPGNGLIGSQYYASWTLNL